MAAFIVTQSFVVENRHLFVLEGKLLQGTIEAGMIASSSDKQFIERIESAEFVEYVSEGRAAVGLTFAYADNQQLAEWQLIAMDGRTLTIGPDPRRFACPCCGYWTLDEKPPGTHDICPVCYWEDDGVQSSDPNFEGGANDASLNQAKKSFAGIGASEPRFRQHVRRPRVDEFPPT